MTASEDPRPLLEAAYAGSHVVEVIDTVPDLARLQGTDAAEIAAFEDASTGRWIVIAAIDNLGKGAAGQAVQNANLALGLDETAGPAPLAECSSRWPSQSSAPRRATGAVTAAKGFVAGAVHAGHPQVEARPRGRPLDRPRRRRGDVHGEPRPGRARARLEGAPRPGRSRRRS